MRNAEKPAGDLPRLENEGFYEFYGKPSRMCRILSKNQKDSLEKGGCSREWMHPYAGYLQLATGLYPQRRRNPGGWIIEALMKWMQTQSLLGKLPRLGDAQVSLRAEGGQLRDTPQPGIARYEITLIAEYTNYYEVI